MFQYNMKKKRQKVVNLQCCVDLAGVSGTESAADGKCCAGPPCTTASQRQLNRKGHPVTLGGSLELCWGGRVLPLNRVCLCWGEFARPPCLQAQKAGKHQHAGFLPFIFPSLMWWMLAPDILQIPTFFFLFFSFSFPVPTWRWVWTLPGQDCVSGALWSLWGCQIHGSCFPQPEVSHARCQGWNVLRSVLLIVWVILRDGASKICMLLRLLGKLSIFSVHLIWTQLAAHDASCSYGMCEKLGRIFFTGYFPDCSGFCLEILCSGRLELHHCARWALQAASALQLRELLWALTWWLYWALKA